MVTDGATETRSGAGPSDAALVIAARAGELWAQEALFLRYGKKTLGLAQRILAHREDADDLVQDAFVYAFTRLDSLQNPQAFAAWLMSIVVRTASKRLRKRRLLRRLGLRAETIVDPEAMASPNAPVDVAAELRSVYGVLAELDPEQRVALVLKRVEGLELREIGEQMGLSLATVKRRVQAAESKLKLRFAGL